MTFLLLLPTLLCLLTTAALCLHENLPLLAPIYLALCLLLILRHRAILRITQIILVLSCLLWISTAYSHIQERLQFSEPYLRLAIIEFSVAAFHLLAAALFQTPRLRAHYAPTPTPPAPPPAP